MWYEIWDWETRNILSWHDTGAEALAIVTATIARHGRDAVATWMLVQEDGMETETDSTVAVGESLADYALRLPSNDA